MNLSGNVTLTAKDESGRLWTLRASKVRVQNADLELQVEDKLFDSQMGWLDQLQAHGQIAGVPESALNKAFEQHPKFAAYRLRFSGVGAGAQLSGIVLWNRQTKILRAYSILNYPEPGILDVSDITFRAVDEARLLSVLDSRKEKGPFEEASLFNLKKFNPFTNASRRFRFGIRR